MQLSTLCMTGHGMMSICYRQQTNKHMYSNHWPDLPSVSFGLSGCSVLSSNLSHFLTYLAIDVFLAAIHCESALTQIEPAEWCCPFQKTVLTKKINRTHKTQWKTHLTFKEQEAAKSSHDRTLVFEIFN